MLTLAEKIACRLLNAQGFRSRWIHTPAGRMHVLDKRGSGLLPPIAMLHGFSANAISYMSMLLRFIPYTRRLIAPDLPGHGFSHTPADGLQRKTVIEGLFSTLDQVIDEPVILVGTSLGGFAAARYAAAHPRQVRALVLIAPGGAPMPETQLQCFLDTFRIQGYSEALKFVDNMFASSPPLLRHALAHGVRSRFAHPELQRLLNDITPDDMLQPEELEALSMPILLLWGRDERILPRCHLDFFRRHLPNHACIEEWDNFGHCGFLEHPGAITKRIVEFSHNHLRAYPNSHFALKNQVDLLQNQRLSA